MSFALRDLSVLAYANGFTLWHYKNPAAAGLRYSHEANYFGGASDLFAAGDMVLVSGNGAGALLIVSAVAPSGVNVRPLT